MSDLLARARILRERHRHEEAVAVIHQVLAEDPDHPQAHLELAFTRKDMEGMAALALEDARRATALIPDHPYPLALQARILCKLGRFHDALQLAEAALGLAPEDPYAWNSKTIALIDLGRYAEAEQSARHTLKLAPDDVPASNLLSLVLRQFNRLDESMAESLRQLARNAEEPYPFVNAGWAELHRGRVKEAEVHFKESLRLVPGFKDAQRGLKEAFRARSLLYRWLSRYHYIAFYRPWVVIVQVAAFVVLVIGLGLGGREKAVMAVIISFFSFYLVFAYFITIAPGLSHFAILWDPVARLSLERREKADGVVTVLLVSGGLGLLLAGLAGGKAGVLTAGGILLATALPLSQFFVRTSPLRQAFYLACGAFIFCTGLYSAWQMLGTPPDADHPDDTITGLVLCFVLAAFVTARNCSHIFLRRKND